MEIKSGLSPTDVLRRICAGQPLRREPVTETLKTQQYFVKYTPKRDKIQRIRADKRRAAGPRLPASFRLVRRQLTGRKPGGSKLLIMDNKPDQNLFREVHRRVRDLRDQARKNRDDALQRSHKVAEDEARKEGFDRPAAVPQLPEDGSQ